jgi:hypothetical protein
VRRYTALAVALACLAAAAPTALADSIVYERNGNVWLTNPDGTGQRQVTTGGGYLALFAALGGTSVAAVSLSHNSVKSKHLSMELNSNSTASDHLVTSAWTSGPLAGAAQSAFAIAPSSATGAAIVAHNGSGDDHKPWNGHVLHSTPNGLATVTFHAFASLGACGLDGVGTVAN